MPLYYLDALVLAEPPHDLPYVGPDLAVDGLSPILRREHDVVLAHPLRARKAVGFVGHSRTPPFLLGFLTARTIVNIRREGGFVKQVVVRPHSGWFTWRA